MWLRKGDYTLSPAKPEPDEALTVISGRASDSSLAFGGIAESCIISPFRNDFENPPKHPRRDSPQHGTDPQVPPEEVAKSYRKAPTSSSSIREDYEEPPRLWKRVAEAII